jgi:hypothetical protein
MDAESATPLLGHAHADSSEAWDLRGTFATSLAGLTAVLLGLLAAFAQYAPGITDAHVDQYYSYFTDVSVSSS